MKIIMGALLVCELALLAACAQSQEKPSGCDRLDEDIAMYEAIENKNLSHHYIISGLKQMKMEYNCP